MPQLTFVLPHWIYWSGLLLLPLFYMALLRLTQPESKTETSFEYTNSLTRAIDSLSHFTGVFVSYWTVIAVFVYFYEVIARYFFNSPTNWAHESMFLMFGMQYILSGAYAYRHGAHVRVDVFYSKLSERARVQLDIVTQIAFFIFCIAFIRTGWRFFATSMNQTQFPFALGFFNEVSFTEWAVAYYPVKGVLVVGGILLLLQGISRFIKDILYLQHHER